MSSGHGELSKIEVNSSPAGLKYLYKLMLKPVHFSFGLHKQHLYGLPETTISKLQCVQNVCAKLALGKGKYDSPTQCIMELHWLPVRQQISFKILVLMYKCLHGEALECLKDLIVILNPTRPGLRSGSTTAIHLITPTTKCKTFANRSFSVAAPTLWNSLPVNLRLSDSLTSFKKNLKTHLFRQAYYQQTGETSYY